MPTANHSSLRAADRASVAGAVHWDGACQCTGVHSTTAAFVETCGERPLAPGHFWYLQCGRYSEIQRSAFHLHLSPVNGAPLHKEFQSTCPEQHCSRYANRSGNHAKWVRSGDTYFQNLCCPCHCLFVCRSAERAISTHWKWPTPLRKLMRTVLPERSPI